MFGTSKSAIALAAAMLLWGSARANTLYVSPTGKYGTHTAYTTIQAAVNNASSGDTILVAAATYQEDVTIGTAGLILKGHQHGVDPRPGRTGPESILQGSITITGANVHINGFTVDSTEQWAIEVGGASAPSVAATGCVINYNVVNASIYGIQVGAEGGPSTPKVSLTCHVSYNLLSCGNSAIVLFNTKNNRVRYNKVAASGYSGVDNYYADSTIIENNECDNCNYAAIRLRGSTTCTVTGDFGTGDANGVSVEENSSNNTINNNNFT